MKKNLKKVLALILVVCFIMTGIPQAAFAAAPPVNTGRRGNERPIVRLAQTGFNAASGILSLSLYVRGQEKTGSISSARIFFSVDKAVLTPVDVNGTALDFATNKGLGAVTYGGSGSEHKFADAVNVDEPNVADEEHSQYLVYDYEEQNPGSTDEYRNGRIYNFLEFSYPSDSRIGASPDGTQIATIYFKVAGNTQDNLSSNSFALATPGEIGRETASIADPNASVLDPSITFTIASMEYFEPITQNQKRELGYYYGVLPTPGSPQNIGNFYSEDRVIPNFRDIPDVIPDNEEWNVGIDYTGWNRPSIEELYVNPNYNNPEMAVNVEIPKVNLDTGEFESVTTDVAYEIDAYDSANGSFHYPDPVPPAQEILPTGLFWEMWDPVKDEPIAKESYPAGVSLEIDSDGEATGQLVVTSAAAEVAAGLENAELNVYLRASKTMKYMEESDSPVGVKTVKFTLAADSDVYEPAAVVLLDKDEATEDIEIDLSGAEFTSNGYEFYIGLISAYGVPVRTSDLPVDEIGTMAVSVDNAPPSTMTDNDKQVFDFAPVDESWAEDGKWTADDYAKVKLQFADGKKVSDFIAEAGTAKISATYIPTGTIVTPIQSGSIGLNVHKAPSKFDKFKLLQYAAPEDEVPKVDDEAEHVIISSTLDTDVYFKAIAVDQYGKEIPTYDRPEISSPDAGPMYVTDNDLTRLYINRGDPTTQIRLSVSGHPITEPQEPPAQIFRINYVRENRTFSQVEISGKNAISSILQIPPTVIGAEYQLSAIAKDQYNLPLNDNGEIPAGADTTWTVDGTTSPSFMDAVTLSKDGKIKLVRSLSGGERLAVRITVSYTPDGGVPIEVSDIALISLGAVPTFTSIVTDMATSYDIPTADEPQYINIRAIPKDQYGNDIAIDGTINWSLEGENIPIGVEISPSLTPDAQNMNMRLMVPSSTVATSFRIRAVSSLDSTKELHHSISLVKDNPVLTEADIDQEKVAKGIPTQLSVTAKDQYGEIIRNTTVNWLRATASSSDGQATVTLSNTGVVEAGANASSVTVFYTVNGGVERSKTLAVVDGGNAVSVTLSTLNENITIPRKVKNGDIVSDGTPATAAITAVVRDASNVIIRNDLVWDFEEIYEGVLINENGVVSVTSNAKPGNITVAATDKTTGATGYITLTLNYEEGYPQNKDFLYVDISPSVVPYNAQIQITATAYDQYGNPNESSEIIGGNNGNIQWSTPGGNHGSWGVSGGNRRATYGLSVTPSGAENEYTEDFYNLNVAVDMPSGLLRASKIIRPINHGGASQDDPYVDAVSIGIGGTDTITIPVSGADVAQSIFTANAYDDFGLLLGAEYGDYARTRWSIDAPADSGVQLAIPQGQGIRATIAVSDTASEGEFRLTAEINDSKSGELLTATKKIKLVYSEEDFVFDGHSGSVEIVDNNVYRGVEEFQLTSLIKDKNDNPLKNLSGLTEVWSLDAQVDGVSLKESGRLTVESDAEAQSISVTLTVSGNSKTASVTKNIGLLDGLDSRVLDRIEITNTDNIKTIYIPSPLSVGSLRERLTVFGARGFDRNGVAMDLPDTLTWSLLSAPTGMSINENGVVRVDSATFESTNTTIIVKDVSGVEGRYSVKAEYEPEIFTRIEVMQDLVNGNKGAPAAGVEPILLKARYLNQYGVEMQLPSAEPVWSMGTGVIGQNQYGEPIYGPANDGAVVDLSSAGYVTFDSDTEFFFVNVSYKGKTENNRKITVSTEPSRIERLTITPTKTDLKIPKPTTSTEDIINNSRAQFIPKAYDQYNERVRDFSGSNALVFDVLDVDIYHGEDEEQDGISLIQMRVNGSYIQSNAQINISRWAPSGSIMVRATNTNGSNVAVATAMLSLERYPSEIVGVRITTGDTIGATADAVQLQYEHRDEYESPVVSTAPVEWTLEGYTFDRTKDPTDIAPTLTSDGKLMLAYNTSSVTVKVTSADSHLNSTNNSDAKTISISNEPSKPSRIELTYQGSIPVRIPRIGGNPVELVYTAQLYDQYSTPLDSAGILWNIETHAGVRMETATGTVAGTSRKVSKATISVSNGAKAKENLVLTAIDRDSEVAYQKGLSPHTGIS